ncbi:MAG: hypothetical protein ACTSY1_02335 [Alphaproteobacteria bacterium]
MQKSITSNPKLNSEYWPTRDTFINIDHKRTTSKAKEKRRNLRELVLGIGGGLFAAGVIATAFAPFVLPHILAWQQ